MPRSGKRPPPSPARGRGRARGPSRVGGRGQLAGRASRGSPGSVSRRAVPAVQQRESSSETEDSESENDDRSSATESDSSHSESDGGDDSRHESDRSSDDSDDAEVGSSNSASEDEVDETVEATEENELESTVEVRVHVHEAKELTPMDGSTSDPYAYVTCFGRSERTKTASKGTDAIWDEELQFSGTMGELKGGVVSVAVWDEDFGADDLIGSFDFDLEDVRKRSYKEVRAHCLLRAGPRSQLLVLRSQVEFIWTSDARTFAVLQNVDHALQPRLRRRAR